MAETCVASGSLQTERAIYLTKTPFQLRDILMRLHMESDSCDRSVHAKNRLETLANFRLLFNHEVDKLTTVPYSPLPQVPSTHPEKTCLVRGWMGRGL